jgi:hypothetical protein
MGAAAILERKFKDPAYRVAYKEQQDRIDTLEGFINKRMGTLSTGLASFRTNGFVVTDEMKLKLDSGMYTMDSTRYHISNFKSSEEKLMQERKERLTGFFRGAKLVAIGSLVIVKFALYLLITFNRNSGKGNTDKRQIGSILRKQ